MATTPTEELDEDLLRRMESALGQPAPKVTPGRPVPPKPPKVDLRTVTPPAAEAGAGDLEERMAAAIGLKAKPAAPTTRLMRTTDPIDIRGQVPAAGEAVQGPRDPLLVSLGKMFGVSTDEETRRFVQRTYEWMDSGAANMARVIRRDGSIDTEGAQAEALRLGFKDDPEGGATAGQKLVAVSRIGRLPGLAGVAGLTALSEFAHARTMGIVPRIAPSPEPEQEAIYDPGGARYKAGVAGQVIGGLAGSLAPFTALMKAAEAVGVGKAAAKVLGWMGLPTKVAVGLKAPVAGASMASRTATMAAGKTFAEGGHYVMAVHLGKVAEAAAVGTVAMGAYDFFRQPEEGEGKGIKSRLVRAAIGEPLWWVKDPESPIGIRFVDKDTAGAMPMPTGGAVAGAAFSAFAPVFDAAALSTRLLADEMKARGAPVFVRMMRYMRETGFWRAAASPKAAEAAERAAAQADPEALAAAQRFFPLPEVQRAMGIEPRRAGPPSAGPGIDYGPPPAGITEPAWRAFVAEVAREGGPVTQQAIRLARLYFESGVGPEEFQRFNAWMANQPEWAAMEAKNRLAYPHAGTPAPKVSDRRVAGAPPSIPGTDDSAQGLLDAHSRMLELYRNAPSPKMAEGVAATLERIRARFEFVAGQESALTGETPERAKATALDLRRQQDEASRLRTGGVSPTAPTGTAPTPGIPVSDLRSKTVQGLAEKHRGRLPAEPLPTPEPEPPYRRLLVSPEGVARRESFELDLTPAAKAAKAEAEAEAARLRRAPVQEAGVPTPQKELPPPATPAAPEGIRPPAEPEQPDVMTGAVRRRSIEDMDLASKTPQLIEEFPVASLTLDPGRMQYKGKTDAQGRVIGHPLFKPDARYSRTLTQPVTIWKDPESGKWIVVDGHQRVIRAKMDKVASIPVETLNVETAEEARAVGALKNIAAGHGDVLDAAKFFRDTKIDPSQLPKVGIALSGKFVSDSLALSNLNDMLFGAVSREEFPVERAIIIGRNLPNHAHQDAMVKLIAGRKQDKITNEILEELVQTVKGAPLAGAAPEAQKGLPGIGATQAEQSTAIEVARLRVAIQTRLGKTKSVLGNVSKEKNAEILRMANNAIDREKSLALSKEAQANLFLFERLKMLAGPLQEAINAAALAVRRKETTHERAVDNLFERLGALFDETLGKTPSQPAGPGGGEEGDFGGTGTLFKTTVDEYTPQLGPWWEEAGVVEPVAKGSVRMYRADFGRLDPKLGDLWFDDIEEAARASRGFTPLEDIAYVDVPEGDAARLRAELGGQLRDLGLGPTPRGVPLPESMLGWRKTARASALRWADARSRMTPGAVETVEDLQRHLPMDRPGGLPFDSDEAAAVASVEAAAAPPAPVRSVATRSFFTRVKGGFARTDLLRGKRAKIVGSTIRSMGELAELLQIYRDPRFEHMRFFYIDRASGKILHQEAISSGLVSSVNVALGKGDAGMLAVISKWEAGRLVPMIKAGRITGLEDPEGAAELLTPRPMGPAQDEAHRKIQEEVQRHEDDLRGEAFRDIASNVRVNGIANRMRAVMKKHGADTIVMSHNHPGGNPKASDNDMRLTAELMARLPDELVAHVIINHKKYRTISRGGESIEGQLPGWEQADPLREKSVPFLPDEAQKVGLSPEGRRGAPELAAALKGYAPQPGNVTLAYVSAQGAINGIDEVPRQTVLEARDLGTRIQARARKYGGHYVVALADGSGEHLNRILADLVSEDILADAFLIQPAGYMDRVRDVRTLPTIRGYWPAEPPWARTTVREDPVEQRKIVYPDRLRKMREQLRAEALGRIGNSSKDKTAPMTPDHFRALPRAKQLEHLKARLEKGNSWAYASRLLKWSNYRRWHDPVATADIAKMLMKHAAQHGYRIPRIAMERLVKDAFNELRRSAPYVPFLRVRGMRNVLESVGLGIYPLMKSAAINNEKDYTTALRRIKEAWGQRFIEVEPSVGNTLQKWAESGETPDLLRYKKGYHDRLMLDGWLNGDLAFKDLPAHLQEPAKRTRRLLDEAHVLAQLYGILTPGQFIEEYASRIRKRGSVRHAFPEWYDPTGKKVRVPEKYQVWFEMHRSGELSPRETDPGVWLAAYFRGLYRKIHLEPMIQRFGPMVNKALAEGRIRPAQAMAIEEWFHHLLGRPSRSHEFWNDTIQGFVDKVKDIPHVRAAATRLGIDLEGVGIEGIQHAISGTLYPMALGGRLGATVKNMTQVLHPVQELGLNFTKEGAALFATKEGKQLVIDSGVVADFLPLLESSGGLIDSPLFEVGQKLMFMFQAVDTYLRGVTYLGARRKMMDALGLEGVHIDATFPMTKAEIIRAKDKLGPLLFDLKRDDQIAITTALREGRVADAVLHYGRAIVYDTQFPYGRADSPLLWREPMWRFLGFFTTWPMYWLEFEIPKLRAIGRGLPKLLQAPPYGERPRSPDADRALREMQGMARWLIGAAGIVGAASVVGIETYDWFWRDVPIPGTDYEAALPIGPFPTELPFAQGMIANMAGTAYKAAFGGERGQQEAKREGARIVDFLTGGYFINSLFRAAGIDPAYYLGLRKEPRSATALDVAGFRKEAPKPHRPIPFLPHKRRKLERDVTFPGHGPDRSDR